jgi:inorganic triphosphatase YgiF
MFPIEDGDDVPQQATPPAVATPVRPPLSPNPTSFLANSEVELKLLAEPAQFMELSQAPPIVAHARNKGSIRLLKSIYYDTPTRALYRAGATLRVRQVGKQFIQTLKLMSGHDGEPLRRGEWESPVATMTPDVHLLMPLITIGLQEALNREPLQPVFGTAVRRHMRAVKLPTGTVEVAFDQGVIKAGDKTAPIREIELELKHGSPAALYDLASRLSELGSVRPTIRSKADRGFELAFDAPPPVRKLGPPLVGPDMSVDQAFAAILQSALAQLLVNEPAAEDGRNPEGIHQFRVALRRLRCALALLHSLAPSATLETLRADARWLASNLSGARSWDVFLSETLVEVASGCDGLQGFDAVRALAEQARAASYATVRQTLATPRSGRFQLALGAWIEQRGWRHDVSSDNLAALAAPVIAFANAALTKRHDKVLKRGRHFKQLPIAARHDLRLAAKKLRYTADFFLPLFNQQASAKRYTRRLSRLQDHLGRYNDAAATRQLIAQLPLDAMSSDSRQALGAVLGWQACWLRYGENELRAAWRVFRDAPRPWARRHTHHHHI